VTDSRVWLLTTTAVAPSSVEAIFFLNVSQVFLHLQLLKFSLRP
jgi:hypothetical protein